MVRKFFIAGISFMAMLGLSAQENTVKRLPEIGKSSEYTTYTEARTGFYCATEIMGAYSCRISNPNFGFVEWDVMGGYRFNEYFHLGLGAGARYYCDNNAVRYKNAKWGGPLFVDIRGQFIPSLHRNVVPYYSFDIGGTFADGFMMRPTIGLRIGQDRSAFLIGLSYTGQNLDSFKIDGAGARVKDSRFVSFITLKLGYQF